MSDSMSTSSVAAYPRKISLEPAETPVETVRQSTSESPTDRSVHGLGNRRLWIRTAVAIAIVSIIGWAVVPRIILAWTTVSTDDAYIDGHVTFVAPRVSGQVSRVLVDDNMRVKRGDLLVQIDPEPFRVEVEIQQAQVAEAETELAVAHAQVEAEVAQARSARFGLDHEMEIVRDRVALLRTNVAQLQLEQASLTLAQRDFDRNKKLVDRNVITPADFDMYEARRDEAQARVNSAEQVIQQTRASLGLPVNNENPLAVPDDLDQNFSLVRQALASLMQDVAQLGYRPPSWELTPRAAYEEFFRQDSKGDLDRIYAQLTANAPAVKQAEAKLQSARRNLELAELNLRYCDIVSEIDGVVTRRNVNPGNYVESGQSLMAVRSLQEIWINANFKETQLAQLRIGQRVALHVDMYGGEKEFNGRITGFTMGTGQTLALLPPQNATGNFVKIVQRLPVRVELTDYDPEQLPLFVGLSVEPYVYVNEPPTGPHAGEFLQPLHKLPTDDPDHVTDAMAQPN